MSSKGANWRAGDAGSEAPDVLNGIAWDAASKRLFAPWMVEVMKWHAEESLLGVSISKVTGKLWSQLYEIQVKPSQVSVEQARRFCIPKSNLFRR